MAVNRRDFLRNTLHSSVGLLALNELVASGFWGKTAQDQRLKISVQCYSFVSEIFKGSFDILDFPKRIREDFGLSAAEYWNLPLAQKRKNPEFLKELQKRTADQGIVNTLMLVDLINFQDRSKSLSLCDSNKTKRDKAVAAHYEWIDVAKTIGCSAIRVNLRAQELSAEEVAKISEESLHQLLEYSAAREMSIVIENHGGYTSDAQWVVALMKKINNSYLGTLPDFGTSNFCVERAPAKEGDYFSSECITQYDKYQGVQELLPYAKGISAKTAQFDADGEDIDTDFKRMLDMIKASSFEGYLAIEYEGGMMQRYGGKGNYLPPKEGILATKKLIEKYRS